MLPINHLLCLVPDEEPSTAACRSAVRLARITGATLHLLSLPSSEPASFRTALQAEADDGDAFSFCVADLPADPDALVDTVQQYARREAIDLVVTDTPSDRGPIPPLAAPRVQPLLRRLDCSVLVVGHDTPLRNLRRLFVPTDLTPSSATAFEYAAALAARCDAALDLLHVIETDPYVALTRTDRLSLSDTSFPERRAHRRLASFLDTHPGPDVPVASHVTFGDPADQIGRFVNRHAVDVMVLSARSGASTSSLGSVADRVLRRVTCPVLLVRPPPRDADASSVSDAPDAPSV